MFDEDGGRFEIQLIGYDDMDTIELQVAVVTDAASMAVRVFVSSERLRKDLRGLSRLVELRKAHADTNQFYDLRLSDFGPELAYGAVHARFHAVDAGLFVTCQMQGEFDGFGRKEVADVAVFHLLSDPAWLEAFELDLAQLAAGRRQQALLRLLPRANFTVQQRH